MQYVLIGIPVLIAVLIGIAAIRTLMIKAPATGKCETVITPEETETAAKKLGDMVRVPTVSKNEDEDLSEFYKFHEVLEKSFPNVHKTFEKTVLNGTLLYRWQGTDPSRRPILFMGHQDVVPANDHGWKCPAYSGTVIDGAIYGRGSMDCKSTMYVELQAMEELIAEGFVPPCDIWLEYAINEETGGDGAASAVRYLKEKGIEFAIVIDEGGAIVDRPIAGMDREYAVIGVTEKGYMDLKISAKGKGGHSSTPPRNTPAARLFAFANEIEKKRPFKKHLIPEVYEMFGSMAPSFSFGMRMLLGNIWLFKPLLIALMPVVSPFGEAILSTTCCFTMMKGSDACNVIPKEPYLVANLRTSVHQNCEESLAVLKKYADKYDLEIEIIQARDASPVSNIHSKEYAYLTDCIKKQFPDVGVAPYVIMGGTDCRHFHALTENALRFCPVRMSNEQNAACHAVNENVTLSALAEGVRFFKEFVKGYNL
ncbi:MAG: M20/M25/M40 family metallo-hydrolase [Oscillospiraceae bacterium]|nr:M20/M25/M40 family metallo-hydrolase [Oscillospiraceae bacterium]MBQ4644108.1 M20/M25/M40 family metallo-hydrolase [Oscillospiraceae bacterium]